MSVDWKLEGSDTSDWHSDPDEEPVCEPRPMARPGTSGRRRFRAADQDSYEARRFAATGARNGPKYGITEERFWELVEQQDGRCPICLVEFDADGPLMAIDHNHDSNEVRGILCRRCNSGLGVFADSPDRLARALSYLLERGCYGEATEHHESHGRSLAPTSGNLPSS